MSRSPLILFFAVAAFFSSASAPVQAGRPASTGLRDLAGNEANPFAAKGARWLAFVFVRVDCPVANAYAPEIQRLAKVYGGRGVEFHLVYCDPDETPKVIRKHLAEYRYDLPAFRDERQRFARQGQVTITPEAALFTASGKLVYHGRIDNRYAELGKARPRATERDLMRALDAVLAGKTAPPATEPAVGCFIEGL
jgi:hypothetical protein